jgi:hypothetical protein
MKIMLCREESSIIAVQGGHEKNNQILILQGPACCSISTVYVQIVSAVVKMPCRNSI